ncbi:hypothetical protein EVJ58_g261 [Rhodofomes roseus]|uniref:Integrase catalytic domain-containing protein n=1 Tax=Rhodofomes roseus TaxID=34475 RepID=A0A4Y9Z7B5_9APHY|nr:hypothetical protein EVJ58_g261 [Rhodofomes roseus]
MSPVKGLKLDASECQELRNFENRSDLAAGEIWGDNPEAMWVKLESVHMQKRPGTCFTTLLSLSKAVDESLSTQASQLKSDIKVFCPQDLDIAKLDNELVIKALNHALPTKYAALLHQTLLLDDTLTLEKLQDTFVALKNQPGVLLTIPVLSQIAAAVICGRSGHSEEQCFSKRNASIKATHAVLLCQGMRPRSLLEQPLAAHTSTLTTSAWHTDLSPSPSSNQPQGHALYVYAGGCKSDTFFVFQAFETYSGNTLRLGLKATHDDKGGEYMGKQFVNFCTQHGIQHQHTEPDEPNQNHCVTERANRTIAEGRTALFVQLKLPLSFWAHTVSAYVHTQNHMPTLTLQTAWKANGHKPDVSYFRAFGCLITRQCSHTPGSVFLAAMLRNLLPQNFRLNSQSPASTPEPDQCKETHQHNSPSPDPLIDAPLSPPAAMPAPPPEPVSPPSPTSSDDELDFLCGDGHKDALGCSLEAMIAGVEHVYSAERKDFLSYDEALDFAS